MDGWDVKTSPNALNRKGRVRLPDYIRDNKISGAT